MLGKNSWRVLLRCAREDFSRKKFAGKFEGIAEERSCHLASAEISCRDGLDIVKIISCTLIAGHVSSAGRGISSLRQVINRL